jgi:anti-anti-sigma regulatory factor
LTVLLGVVSKYSARVVLIDISGVPVVDSEAARHLSRTAQAVGLLGAAAILVGTSAEVARTMVAAGIDLGRLETLSDLESGLQHALALIGPQDRRPLRSRPPAKGSRAKAAGCARARVRRRVAGTTTARTGDAVGGDGIDAGPDVFAVAVTALPRALSPRTPRRE